jgi:thioredoxin 1
VQTKIPNFLAGVCHKYHYTHLILSQQTTWDWLAIDISHNTRHLSSDARLTMMVTPAFRLRFVLAFTIFHSTLSFTNAFMNTHSGGSLGPMRLNNALVLRHALSEPNLDDTNYKQILFADSYDKAVLVDACATYCGPCKLIEPVLETCTNKWQESLDFIKFDVDAAANPNLKLELLMQNAMPRSLPCLLLFQEGKVIAKHTGIITEEELDALLETHLGTVKSPTQKRSSSKGFVSMARDDSGDDYMLKGTI